MNPGLRARMLLADLSCSLALWTSSASSFVPVLSLLPPAKLIAGEVSAARAPALLAPALLTPALPLSPLDSPLPPPPAVRAHSSAPQPALSVYLALSRDRVIASQPEPITATLWVVARVDA